MPARWVQRPPSSVPATGRALRVAAGTAEGSRSVTHQVGAPAHRDRAVRARRRRQRDRQRDLLLGMPGRAVVAAAVHGGRDRDPRVERRDRARRSRARARRRRRAGCGRRTRGRYGRPRAGRRRRGRRARARAARWPPRRARRTAPGRRRAGSWACSMRARCDGPVAAKASSTSSFARSPIACTAASIPCAARGAAAAPARPAAPAASRTDGRCRPARGRGRGSRRCGCSASRR